MRGILVCVGVLLAAACLAQIGGVPAKTWKHLHRGVNVCLWFRYMPETNTEAHMAGYLNEQDMGLLKKLDMQFVRLCVAPKVIVDGNKPKVKELRYVDAAIAKFLNRGLSVVWDLHDEKQLNLDTDQGDSSAFVAFWESLARHYKGQHETQLIFELANEPVFMSNPEKWYEIQARAVKAIRAVDPKRTIVAASTNWNGIQTLVTMKPLAEKNIIYSFHCYDPFSFTHQGATWAGDYVKNIKNVPFPSSPALVQPILSEVPEQYREGVRKYGEENYNEKSVYDNIAKAANWGKTHGVPVLLGEFGSYPVVAPKDSRARYFEALRKAIDELGISSALWGYDDIFGLGRRKVDGKVTLDPLTMRHFFGRG